MHEVCDLPTCQGKSQLSGKTVSISSVQASTPNNRTVMSVIDSAIIISSIRDPKRHLHYILLPIQGTQKPETAFHQRFNR